MKKIRTRIAPSPTGDPHVGTAYIALFNYAFAKSQNGEFFIRIEDTDRKRYTNESENRIFEALRWLNFEFDNLSHSNSYPEINKPVVWPADSNHNPFDGQGIHYIRQSDRLNLYKYYAELLVHENKAYKCYCSNERIEQLAKDNLEKWKLENENHLPNSVPPFVSIYHEQCIKSDNSPNFVIRLKSSNSGPNNGEISFNDGLRGIITSNTYLRDPILIKSDGYPTYHLASVIDDHFMEISHIIRGEEWISSTPIHRELYEAFGWELPEFYHLSLLRNSDRSKLSKRHNPTSILYYRDLGILPETLLNYLGTLGFSFGKERFSTNEMIENFSWDKVSVNGPVFDVDKLKSFSKDDIKNMDFNDLDERAEDFIFDQEKFTKIFDLAKTRVSTLGEIIPLMSFCFGELPIYDQEDFDNITKTVYENVLIIDLITLLLKEIESIPFDSYESTIKNYFKKLNLKPKDYYPLLNMIISGKRSCPPVFEIMKIIGKDITLRRFRHFLKLI